MRILLIELQKAVRALITALGEEPTNLEDLYPKVEMERLAHAGRRCTEEEILAMEEELGKNPQDACLRVKIAGFYGKKWLEAEQTEHSTGKDIEAKLTKYALYLIEHQPDHPAISCSALNPIFSENSAPFQEAAKRLFLAHIEKDKKNVSLLRNAANYFRFLDFNLSEKILKMARDIEPYKPEWPEELAYLYYRETRRRDEDEKARIKYGALALKEQERARALNRFNIFARDLDTLEKLPEYAYVAGEYVRAKKYAKRVLRKCKGDEDADAFHKAHQILGKLALQDSDLVSAGNHLLESARVKGSASLNSFGPSMELAAELLKVGKEEVVLEYLDLCGRFWKGQRREEYIAAIKNGEVPTWR